MRKNMSLVLSGLVVLSACCVNAFAWGSSVKGSGVEKSETRDLAGFTELVLDISADVTVKIGEETKCTVSGDENLLPLILTEIDDKTLRIYSKESFSTSSGITVVIETPLLTKALIRGSGKIVIEDLTAETLDLKINGSGDIITTGKVVELKATINGSGDIRAGNLEAEKASALYQWFWRYLCSCDE